MCSWRGAESFLDSEYCIHITKIIRKPKSVGLELKSSCDGDSGIMLCLEMQEGKAAPPKEFQTAPFNCPFHTAIVLRLVKPWLNKGHVIVGDSAFSSVKTCYELLKRGTYFLGVVKSCHKGYPKKFFEQWGNTNPGRGKWHAVSTSFLINNVQKIIYGLGWMSKKDICKTFIASYSNTAPGQPIIVPRFHVEIVDNKVIRTTVQKSTDRPVVLNELFRNFGKIDLHDRYRQGKLKMEVEWETRIWWHRVFATILGMIFTDCYLAYCYEYDKYNITNESPKSFVTFLNELAHSLIFYQQMELRELREYGGNIDSEVTKLYLRIYVIYSQIMYYCNNRMKYLFLNINQYYNYQIMLQNAREIVMMVNVIIIKWYAR